jgi:glycosyltransferase involved in cell wall biosynthesis
MPKITIYTPTYNCDKYLEKSIDSVLNQTYQDFELIIIDDASTDNTQKILKKYAKNPKIKILKNEKNLGLNKTAIEAIKLAKGEYVIRVDADDYLDENALMIMVDVLERHPEIGMVYPDFFFVNEGGEILDYYRKMKIGEEVELLDLPAMGGCTMIRKSCYKAIGGYRDDVRWQEKYDLWLKFISKFKPYNINLPLFYYRRHGNNMSNETKKLLEARRHIKDKFIEKKREKNPPKILAIIPTRSKFYVYPDFPTKKIAGKPIMYYPISAVKNTPYIKKSLFITEDKALVKKAQEMGIKSLIRPKELAAPGVGIEKTINYILKQLKEKEKYIPDIVVILFITSPLITSEHLKEAINTLIIYDADSVIAVKEDKGIHDRHGKYGLEPLLPRRLLKHERDFIFEETGAFIVTKRKFITDKNLFGKKISHIVLSDDEAVRIDNKFHFWLVEQIIKNKNIINNLS